MRQIAQKEVNSKQVTSSKKMISFAISRPVKFLRSLLANLFWIAAIVHLFIFDLFALVAKRSSLVDSIIEYRALIIIGFACVFLMLLGVNNFLSFFGYIIFYPFVILLWKLPKLLFRNWALVIALFPAIYSAIESFKTNFIAFTFLLISSFVICLSDNDVFLKIAMVVLSLYLLMHFSKRVKLAFSPSTTFANLGGYVGGIWSRIIDSELSKPIPLNVPAGEAESKKAQNLLVLYCFSTVLYFVGEKLRTVVKSRKIDIYFIILFIYTFILTVWIFAMEFLGLQRMDSSNFDATKSGVLDFIGLSLSTLTNSGISPIKASSGVAQVFLYCEVFTAVILFFLFVFIIFTSIRERYKQDLDEIVKEVGDVNEKLALLIEGNSQLKIAAVEGVLLAFSPVLTKWLLKLRHGDAVDRVIADIEVPEKLNQD